jgi:dihydropteroate synthase
MKHYQIKHHAGLIDLHTPIVMGILNVTPDSFSDGGKNNQLHTALLHAEKLWNEGAAILDIGAVSSRPGADWVSEEEEWSRLAPVLRSLTKEKYVISVDTRRTTIAEKALDLGVHIINDISAGEEEGMFDLCAKNQCPIVLMHKKGEPKNMQENPYYQDVVMDVFQYLNHKIRLAKEKNCHEIILDLGFGFGKSIQHNFELFKKLSLFQILEYPILVGISRKSMITKTFHDHWENLTSIQESLHLQALLNGANILRVHDVGLAKKTTDLYAYLV